MTLATQFILSLLPARADVYSASNHAELVSAINSVNAGSGGDTIEVTQDITLSGILPSIASSVIIEGGGRSISGAGNHQIFRITSGDVVIRNVGLNNGAALGGNGGSGGDGGSMGTGNSTAFNWGPGGGGGGGYSEGIGSNGGNGGNSSTTSTPAGGTPGTNGGQGGSGGNSAGPTYHSSSFGVGSGGGYGGSAYYNTNSGRTATSAGSGGSNPGFGGGSGGSGGGGGWNTTSSWGSSTTYYASGGGGGGGGSLGSGGAIYHEGGTVQLEGVSLDGNVAQGGAGGSGGDGYRRANGGRGGGGGDGYGGAIFSTGEVSIVDSGFGSNNSAIGGAGGAGGASGSHSNSSAGSAGSTGAGEGSDLFMLGGTVNYTVNGGTATPKFGTHYTPILRKYGDGTLLLNQTGNSFSLHTHEGVIESAGGGVLASSYLQSYSGGELRISSDDSIRRIQGDGQIKLQGNTLSVTSGSGTFSGEIQGAGVLSLDGGTTILSGLPTTANLRLQGGVMGFTESILEVSLGSGNGQIDFVSGGLAGYGGDRSVTLDGGDPLVWGSGHFMTGTGAMSLGSQSSSSTLDFTNAVNLGSGARQLSVQGSVLMSGDVTGSGSLTIAGSGDFEVGGNLSGSMAIDVRNSGITRFSGTNTNSGTTTLSGGMLMHDGLATTSRLILSGGTLGLDSGDFLGDLGTSSGELEWNSGAFAAAGEDRSVTLNGGSDLTWGSGSFLTSGNMKLSHARSDSTITLTNNLDLGSTTRFLTVEDGSAATDAVLSGDMTGNGLFIVNGRGNLALEGDMSGAMGLRFQPNSSNAKLTLNGVNTYSGSTDLYGGLVIASSSGAISPNSRLLLSGGTLGLGHGDYAGSIGSGPGQLTWNYGGFSAHGADRSVTLNGGSPLTWGASGFSPSWVRLGSSESTHAVELTNSLGLGSGTRTFYVGDGAADTDGILSGDLSGTARLRKFETGTLLLTGTNSYNGGTDIYGGTISVGDGGTNGTIGAGRVYMSNGTLAFNRSDDIQIDNSLEGYGAVEQRGSGVVALTASNSYTRGTTIHSGTVRAEHDLALGNGVVTILGGSLVLGEGVSVPNQVILAGGELADHVGAGSALSSIPIGTNGMGTTMVDILAGTKTESGYVTTGFSTGFASINDNARESDVFSINGTGTDVFTLQMAVTLFDGDEYLGWFDTDAGWWVNAIDGNIGANATSEQLGFSGSYDDFQTLYGSDPTAYVGAWGRDGDESTVWAVLNHNSDFAVIPEPRTWLMTLVAGSLLMMRRRTHRASPEGRTER